MFSLGQIKILPTGVNGVVPPEGPVVALLARVGGLARLLLLGLGGLLGLGLGVLLVTSGIFILFDRRHVRVGSLGVGCFGTEFGDIAGRGRHPREHFTGRGEHLVRVVVGGSSGESHVWRKAVLALALATPLAGRAVAIAALSAV